VGISRHLQQLGAFQDEDQKVKSQGHIVTEYGQKSLVQNNRIFRRKHTDRCFAVEI